MIIDNDCKTIDMWLSVWFSGSRSYLFPFIVIISAVRDCYLNMMTNLSF